MVTSADASQEEFNKEVARYGWVIFHRLETPNHLANKRVRFSSLLFTP
jgi:hypothetical protein